MANKWDLIPIPVDIARAARKKKQQTGKHLYLCAFEELREREIVQKPSKAKSFAPAFSDAWRFQ